MNIVSRTLSGLGFLLIGGGIIYAFVSADGEILWWGLVWGILWMGIGVAILLNTREDDIESITEYPYE